MSENLGIRVDLELNDDKAKTDLNGILKTLEDLAGNKAINLKIDIDGNALKNLTKIENAVKEINRLSKDAQKGLFSGSNTGLDKQRADTAKMYQGMFDTIEKETKKQQKLENQILLAGMAEQKRLRAQQEKERVQQHKASLKEQQQAEKAHIKETTEMYSNMFKQIEQQEKNNTRKDKDMQSMYEGLFARDDKDLLNGYLKALDEKDKTLKSSMDREADMLRAQEKEYKSYSDKLSDSLSRAQREITSLTNSGFSDSNSVSRLQSDLDNLITSIDWDRVDNLTFDRSISEVRRLESEIESAMRVQSNNRRSGEINLFSEKMFSDLNRMKREFREIGNLGSEFSRIEASIRGLDSVAPDRLPQAMRQIRQEVGQLNGDLRNLNSGVRNTNGFFNDLYDSMRTFTLGNMIGNALEDGVRAIKKVVIELDSAMTNMMKVAPENFKGTSAELKKVARDANEVAKGVGQTTEEVIQGTAKALQTGAKTMTDAMEIARNSAMFANVGDVTTEQADTYIASIMSAYGGIENALKPVRENVRGMGDDYNQLTKFMDLANYAGNNFAISTGDVGEALMRSSSVLSEYGVSMQDSIAMIVGANESIQDSAKVGQSMKSMAINMAGVKASAKDGTMELNKTAKALKEIAGVDIYANKKTGQVKDMMTLLDELQGKYKGLADDEKKALGEALAGKHHANTFQALMGNWRKVQEMQKAYQDGMTVGSAQKENERFLDSVSGKINILKENLKQLVTNVLSSDLTKSILDMGIAITDGLVGFSNFINDLGLSVPTAIGLITSLVQVIKTLGTGQTTRGFFRMPNMIRAMIPSLNSTTRGFRAFSGTLSNVEQSAQRTSRGFITLGSGAQTVRQSTTAINSSLGRVTTQFNNVDQSTKKTAKGVTASGKSWKVHTTNVEATNRAVDRLKNGNVRLSTTLQGNNSAIQTATRSSGSWIRNLISANAKSTLASVGTGLLNGALIGLVGSGIALAGKGLVWLATAEKRHREEIDENINAIQENISANQNKISVLNDVGRKYEELSKKSKKSNEDMATMKSYANQLAEALPELKIGQDSEGNAIIAMAGDVDYLIGKLEEANKTQAKLLQGQQSEKAEASRKLLHNPSFFDKSPLEERNRTQSEYNHKLFGIENRKKQILDKIRTAEGDDLRKYNQELAKIELEKEKIAIEYGGKYIEAQQKVAELANDTRLSMMDSIRNSSVFGSLADESKQSLQDFVSLLDFSEVNNDNVALVSKSLEKITRATADGKIDLEDFKKKIVDINSEFAMSGNIETYNGKMSALANSIAEASGADYNVILDMLKSMDEASIQAEVGLDKFLSAYSRTVSDIAKGDKVAEALKAQFDGVSQALDDIANGMSDDMEINKELAINLIGDENIPDQIQDMIRVLLNKNYDPTDVLKVTQKVLIDLQEDGEIDLEATQKLIDSTFDENAFDVTADINVTAKVKEARTDEVLTQLKEKYKEIPEEVETIIKTNSLDSVSQAETILKMYKDFPEEIETMIEASGYETTYSNLSSLVKGYDNIPDEVMTYLKANNVESISKAVTVADIYSQLPENIQTYLLANNSDALLNAQSVEEVYKNIPPMLNTSVELDVSSVDSRKTLIDRVLSGFDKKKTVTEIDASTASFDEKTGSITAKLKTLGEKKGNVKIDADTSPIDKKVNDASSKVSNVKQKTKPKIDADNKPADKKVKDTQKAIDGIKQTKTPKINADSSNAMTKIGKVKDGLSTIPSEKTTTINVVTKYSTKGTPTPQSGGGGSTGYNFGAHSLSTASLPQASSMMLMSQSPITSFGASTSEPASAPSTFNSGYSASFASSAFTSLNARAVTTKTPIANKGNNIADAMEYNIELLKELDNRVQMVNNSLTTLDKKMNKAIGKEKIKYLEQQITLFEEQKQIQKELEDSLIRQRNYAKFVLDNKGFKFTPEGNLTNYEEKLIVLEKELAKKDKALKEANDRVSNEKNEKKKASLESNAKKAQEAYDKDKKNLDDIKSYLNEYIQITTKDLPNAQNEWLELNNKIEEARDEIIKINREIKKLRQDSMFVSLNKQVTQYNNSLKQIDKQMENAFGKEKDKLLKDKIELLKKQEIQLNRVKNEHAKVQSQLQKELEGFGFTFRDNGDIVNYIQHITKLKEDGNKDFDHIQKVADEYLDILINKIPNVESELLDLNNTLFETQWALQALAREQALFANTSRLRELEMQYDKLADKLDLINIQLENAYGKDKLNLIKSQIDLLEEQSQKQETIIKNYQSMLGTYQNDLLKYGVEFNAEGDITNLEDVLGKYKDDKNFEHINKLLEEYIDLQRKDLPDAVKEWEKLNASIKNAYKEQLNITKDIESQITEVYKKQAEERKKLIDSELKKRLDAINKEKEAYKNSREEAKYQDNYNEQLDVIKNLERQLEIAKKDSTESGQKKVQDLLKQLKEEQKKLQDMVQDKIDSDMEDLFDKESDRLEEEAENAKDKIDKDFSDEKIQQLVKEALSTGVFEDIDGTMRSLQDVMLEFVDKYGDGLGATGDLIKNELVANLEIAKDTMKDMVDIYKELGLIKFSYDSDVLSNASRSIPNSRSTFSSAPVINFNKSIVNIEGNVDRDIVDELKAISQEIENNVVDSIVREFR